MEDDPATAELVGLALAEDFGFMTAPNATLTLERLEQQRPDLVIFDLPLGVRTNGVAVFQEMCRRPRRAPSAIVLSSADQAERVARAIGAPFLRKPFTRRALRDMVRTVLAHRPQPSQWHDAVEPGARVAAHVDGQRQVGTVLSNAGGIVRFRDDAGQIFLVPRERIEVVRES